MNKAIKNTMQEVILRNRFKAAFLSFFGTALIGLSAAEKAESSQPNILFILIDDQRNDTLGCAGHPIIKTPNIDRLAADGVRFENAFCTTPICAASRASIMTGLHERTHGFTFGKKPVPKAMMALSYPALLRKAGYRTGFFGKYGFTVEGQAAWHAPAGDFDEFKRLFQEPFFKKQPDGTYRHVDEMILEHAIDFLRTQPTGKPFCLSLSFNQGHAQDSDRRPGRVGCGGHYPYMDETAHFYENEAMPLPKLSDPSYREVLPKFLQDDMNRDRYFWRWYTPEKYQVNMCAYLRMLSGVDLMTGRLMDELGKQGMADNTVIVYTADNGYMMGDRGMAGKWNHFEESLRVPMIIHDPRLPKAERGLVADTMALNIDLAPTFLDLAGVAVPRTYQGRSLMPIVRGEKPPDWRGDVFCEHLMEHRRIPKWEGVRTERYTYARYFDREPPVELLYDRKTDPTEKTDVSGNPEYKGIFERMRIRCDELKDGYMDPERHRLTPQPEQKS